MPIQFDEEQVPCRRATFSCRIIRPAWLRARLVDSGRYRNASEVIREGLGLIERRETEDGLRLKAMREAVDIGAADIGAGRFHDFCTTGSLRDRLSGLTDEALVHRSERTDGNR